MEMRRSSQVHVEPRTPKWPQRLAKRISQLRGMPVIELSSAQRIGNVANVFLNPNNGSVASFDVIRIGDSLERHVKAVDIRRIGKDALVMLPAARWPTSSRPETTDACLDLSDITGLEVIAETGDRVGFISDVVVNPETLAIESYELQTPYWERLFRGQRRIQGDSVLICSHDVMLTRSAHSTTAISVDPELARQDGSDDEWHRRTARIPTLTPSDDTDHDDLTAVRSA